MTWLSTITDVRRFCALVAKDPDLVFISGFVDGRSCMLSLSTAAETDSEMYVVGPQKKRWMAAVKFDGLRFRAVKLRTRAGKKTTARN